ncbi:MAG: Fic family protein [Candidatus Coatesbacteria bacterium]|nr:Fic family protein [Candidatus Coatesbacteria bacterium]
MRRETGQYVTISRVGGEECRAFVPDPLPPNPPLQINSDLQDVIDRALLALGRLDTITTLLPDPSLFLYMYVRKEAVLSSQIEGTQSSFSDLLLFESEDAPGLPLGDASDFVNYIEAMNHGLERLRGGFPLCLRLLREIHRVLLSTGRGSEKEPGEFRTSQNWVGGTRPGNATFVPPPASDIADCMGALEKFLHDQPVRMPLLVKAALAHAQFETIHPFLDGNGRLGRLLITFLLCAEGALKEPMLYLSLYLKNRRQEYYDLLQRVRTEGDWESWLRFFVEGVKETSELAVSTVQRLRKLFEDDQERIQSIGRAAGSVLRVHQALQKSPVATIGKVARLTGLTAPPVDAALRRLQELGIVGELTGRERSRRFGYLEYVNILNEGTEPI